MSQTIPFAERGRVWLAKGVACETSVELPIKFGLITTDGDFIQAKKAKVEPKSR